MKNNGDITPMGACCLLSGAHRLLRCFNQGMY